VIPAVAGELDIIWAHSQQPQEIVAVDGAGESHETSDVVREGIVRIELAR
jgi:hypothetical protein